MAAVISSGHGYFVSGARALIDEVTEARRVVDRVVWLMSNMGAAVLGFHENYARNQRDNVNAIIAEHNRHERELDVSIHFNAVAGIRQAGIGVETLYRLGNERMKGLASQISKAISNNSGLILRRGDGTWGRDNLGFLTRTNINAAVLLEVCFVNSEEDVELYFANFEEICLGIAQTINCWMCRN